MKKRGCVEHRVFNSLLRIEGMLGDPPMPFEKPSDKYDFWVLELTDQPEPFPKWQARALLVLRRHMRHLKKWKTSGGRFFLHVQTESPLPMLPAVFEPPLLRTISHIDCTLEHGVEIESEQERRNRTRRRTVRRKTRRL